MLSDEEYVCHSPPLPATALATAVAAAAVAAAAAAAAAADALSSIFVAEQRLKIVKADNV